MRSHKWYTPWLLVAPAVVWVLVFGLWPFLNTVILSFTDSRPLRTGGFVGLENYGRMLQDEQFGYALTTSVIYMIVCVPLLTILPLLLALLVEKTIPGIAAFRTTFYFPVIASVVVVALIWTWMFDSRGVINQTLQAFGLLDKPVAFLVDRWWLLACAILLTVWKGLGYYMVVYLAALGNVGRELHEAAMLDGAGAFRRFLSVTIPGVRGAMLLISALVAVAAMRVFTELHVLSNGTGGPGGQDLSIVMLIRQVGQGLNGDVGYASALSVALFLLTVLPLIAIAWMNRERRTVS
ncbi:multiple sugar transport system permease protein [Diaminobutyricimonas aerilata]|uniref:Multiple sugar transport system permease protein n=1 Tax=Diaminobutyricimonas aerilata TaxID=1162967 RepID=A0A2M9CI42_9MICO|nr:sugar ABC transporter permease [Diaminobutyricimonas aerilata]PJJ71542.1 multiple sugar transport system permease protein [Diaminobutyricimonas aerilata]